jgi:acyl-CoA reductase-like NAD-dependent aldehyde dehydrogenase
MSTNQAQLSMKQAQPYINGQWISSDREVLPVKSPYSGEVIGEQLLATQSDVENAIASAHAAKKEIANIPTQKRAKILKNAAALLEQEKERFARLISLER